MYKRFRETEGEKINNELLDKYYPREVLHSYYNFGVAQSLIHVIKTIQYHESRGRSELATKEVIDFMKAIGENDEQIKPFFERLMKENGEKE
ncbi:hypothetical protein [Priestia aryabhattai]|uniref:hypothetical protein n=1 Tax=Priestia aryabhattai TaxID=412384 RepID=UPI0015F3604A|nr:hypothetical protein [Priestia aryabhattai]